MQIKAGVSQRQLLRLSVLTFFTVGITCWALYDGFIAWPAQRERQLGPYTAFEELEKEYKESGEVGMWDEWRALAEENGWPASKPEKPKEQYEINQQYIMAAVAGPFGLFFLITLLRTIGRTIEADDTGITASWGPRVEFNQITKIDKKRWEKKGITRLHYDTESGEKKFIVDDFIFDRGPTDEIMYLIELKAGVDKIVNGVPEKDPAEAAAKTEPAEAEPAEQSVES